MGQSLIAAHEQKTPEDMTDQQYLNILETYSLIMKKGGHFITED